MLAKRSQMQQHAEPSAGPYLCELFENERCQPFRGWGHTWPGHFLPTDRVGHWSNRDGGPGGKASMSFRSVAPKLPQVQHVDLTERLLLHNLYHADMLPAAAPAAAAPVAAFLCQEGRA